MSEFCAKFEILLKTNDPEYIPVYLDNLVALNHNMV